MDIIINPIAESPFSYDDVVNLLHESFKERQEQGLEFTCSTMTVESFKNRTKQGTVLVAWDKDANSLLGTVTITLYTDSEGVIYGYHENLAISPCAKRLGIGAKLLEECIIITTNAGGQYILSDTAVGATSSVRWHKKNGFRIIGLVSYQSTNYYSYYFRKQLIHLSKWDNPFFCWLGYMKSSLNTRARRKANGKPTFIASTIKKIINR